MALNLFSLVLASSTGWALLALGYLPVARLKRHGIEMLKAVVAWIVIAATATPGVFHWYLIFALLCLVAWTKLDRPAGKITVAAVAALSLSLGIIFPLAISPALLDRQNIFALGLLYAGGSVAGIAYVLSVVCGPAPANAWRPVGFARGLVIATGAWIVMLGLRCRVGRPTDLPIMMVALVLAVALVFLAWLSAVEVGRDRLRQARLLGGLAALLGLGDSLVAQLLIR